MSSEGPKREGGGGGGGGGGEVWIGLEWQKNSKIRRPTVAAAAALAGSIRARTVAVGRENLPAWSPRRAPPPWPVRLARGWSETPHTTKTRLA